MPEYSAPVGAPTWFDLMSSDTARAIDFYGEIFGWEVQGPPREEFGGYQNFTKNGRRVAGLMPTMPGNDGPADVWSVYLRTEDPAATVTAVEAAGGSVMVPPMEVGTEGTMLVVIDSAGAVIGFWKPNEHVGYSQHGEHGTPYWFDCQSKNFARSVDFYRSVTGARVEKVADPDGAYAQIFTGDTAYAGIMDAATVSPPEAPSYWQVYVDVDDVAASTAQIERLGGEILMPAEVTPYGTLAVVTDPLGAGFALGHPPTDG